MIKVILNVASMGDLPLAIRAATAFDRYPDSKTIVVAYREAPNELNFLVRRTKTGVSVTGEEK